MVIRKEHQRICSKEHSKGRIDFVFTITCKVDPREISSPVGGACGSSSLRFPSEKNPLTLNTHATRGRQDTFSPFVNIFHHYSLSTFKP